MGIMDAMIQETVDDALKNDNLECIIKLGEGYLMVEDDDSATDEAKKYLINAISMDPNNYNALVGLAKAYEKKNDIDLAIKFAEQASLKPNANLNSVYYLGMLFLKKKEMKIDTTQ